MDTTKQKAVDMASKRSFLGELRDATKELRRQNGWSQADLGDKLGVSTSAISAFEGGVSLLREEPFDELMSLLSSPDTLLAREIRGLADFIENPNITKDAKNKRFRAFLEAYISAFNIPAPVKKSSNRLR